MKLSTLLLAVTLSLPTSALAGPLADPPAYQLEQDFQKALTLATAFHHATHRQIRAMVAQKLTGDPARDAARIHKLVEGYIVNLAAIGHHEAILVNDIDPPLPGHQPIATANPSYWPLLAFELRRLLPTTFEVDWWPRDESPTCSFYPGALTVRWKNPQ